MATFKTHYEDKVGVDVHRVPLEEVKRLGYLGRTRFLDDYPEKGRCLRIVEFRIGSIMVNLFANTNEHEEMTDEPECAD